MEINTIQIENRIYAIRGVQVMLDSDLAAMYQTETKYINRAVNRNPSRFPDIFAFQLIEEEWTALKFQIGTLNTKEGRGTHRKYLPTVFTEQGVSMLSAVLNTEVAVHVSIQIIQAFVAMRKTMGQLDGVILRLEGVELKQIKMDIKLEQVFKALERDVPAKQGIFFEGQLFDAHVFVSNLIKQANKSVFLVDNYVDESTLLLLSKRKTLVSCTVYTRISAVLKKDLEKHNLQYGAIHLIENHSSHDRFLILDNTQLYHIGASLKDLGKKCFAFSRMDDVLPELRTKILKS